MDRFSYDRATRKPKRISITVSDKAFRQLQERSDLEGRSSSNLAAFLLELGLDQAERLGFSPQR